MKRMGWILLLLLTACRLWVAPDPTGYAQTLEEWTDTGSGLHLAKTHTYGLDLISTTSSLSLHPSYFLYDGHGSVRALADETGAITDTYSYDAFGNQLAQSGNTDNTYRYCGEYFDADLALYYLRARHLNPNTGRFHTLDTYEGRNSDPLTLHKYMYAHANPVMGSDPTGKATLTDVQFTQVIQQILRKAQSNVALKVTFRKSGCLVLEFVAEEAVSQLADHMLGIYLFNDDFGTYTGKSIDMKRRLAEHGDRIKDMLGKIKILGVDAKDLSKVEQLIFDRVRQILEVQSKVRKNTDKISNKINPLNKKLRQVVKICK